MAVLKKQNLSTQASQVLRLTTIVNGNRQPPHYNKNSTGDRTSISYNTAKQQKPSIGSRGIISKIDYSTYTHKKT
jgi:hypothetical protein